MDEKKGTEVLKQVTDDAQKVSTHSHTTHTHTHSHTRHTHPHTHTTHTHTHTLQEIDGQIIAAITALVKENVEVLGDDSSRSAADGIL